MNYSPAVPLSGNVCTACDCTPAVGFLEESDDVRSLTLRSTKFSVSTCIYSNE